MPISTPDDGEAELMTTVDDEQYDELCELAGERVVYTAVWEDSLADALGDPASSGLADVDLYLQDGVYFELYGTLCYPSLNDDPLPTVTVVEQTLQKAVAAGATLHEVAVDEEDGLVLVLAVGDQPVLYIVVGGWILDEWDELPEPPTP